MATNRRIFFACQAIGVAQDGVTSFTAVHGLQTLGMNTKYNLVQTFEMGQLSIYENSEDVPDIEITMERVLDGWPLLYHLLTLGATSATMAGRSATKTTIALSVYPDTSNDASGNPNAQATCSGMFVSSVGYTVAIDGPAKETITAVGNNKTWSTSSFTFTPSVFNELDAPFQSGIVNRRQHIVNQPINPTGTAFQQFYTKYPVNIPGISASGTNDLTAGIYGAHIQNVRISADLGRDQLLEIGRRGPYFRYVNFPVEVRAEYDVYSLRGDLMGATEDGLFAGGLNVTNQTITLAMQEGLYVDCGTKAKCTGVNYTGANAGSRGGNAIMTFTFQTFNDFKVLHPQDPSGFTS